MSRELTAEQTVASGLISLWFNGLTPSAGDGISDHDMTALMLSVSEVLAGNLMQLQESVDGQSVELDEAIEALKTHWRRDRI